MIPDSVTSIGYDAFSGCSGLTKVINHSHSSIGLPGDDWRNADTGADISSIANGTAVRVSTILSYDKYKYYLREDGTAMLTEYTGTVSGNLRIPSKIEEYTVTGIGSNLYRNCRGFSGRLRIPYTITSIGGYAFSGCGGFTGLTLPSGLTFIGGGAFSDCSGFTGSLNIPNSVTTIGSSAFSGCSHLTGSLTIPDSVITIGERAFSDCSGFTGSLTIQDSVTTIGERAFSDCSGFTGSLTISDSVTSIGSSAFYNCSGFTGSLTIPDSVGSIGNYTFYDCSGFTGSLTIPNSVTTIGYGAFSGCSGFTGSLTIPDSVGSIGNYTFYDCSGFTGSLTIPNSVTTIGNEAFSDCSGFTGSLTIPDSVTSIGYGAFSDCRGLKGSLIIPRSVIILGNNPFSSCEFEEIKVDGRNPNFTSSIRGTRHNGIFSKNGKILYVGCQNTTIPNRTTNIWKNAFLGCRGIGWSITIPETITEIDSTAFEGCGTLALVNNKSSATLYLGNTWDYKWKDFSTDETITSISKGTAYNVSALYSDSEYEYRINGKTKAATLYKYLGEESGSLVIPASIGEYAVTTIGDRVFSGCSGFTGSLMIPDNVTTIEEEAFSGCSGFTGNLTIPNSVTTIGYEAFKGCSGFTGSLTIPNSVTTIGSEAFSGCSGFTGSLTIPDSVTTIGWEAFYGCSGFTGSLTIPDNVTSIGYDAFEGCSGFTGSLTIPNSVTTIGYYAFKGCSGITKVNNKSDYGIELSTMSDKKWKNASTGEYITYIANGIAIREDHSETDPDNPENPDNTTGDNAGRNSNAPVEMKYKGSVNVKSDMMKTYMAANPNAVVKKTKFKSSNKKVAKVKKSGDVKGGKRSGSATITMYVKTQTTITKANGKTKKKLSKWTSAGTITVNNTGKSK